MILDSGLPEPNPPEIIPNTMPALALTAWASTQPAGAKALHDVLFRRYWAEGQNVAERDVLVDAAGEAALDQDVAADALDDPYWVEVVRGETAEALEMGAAGVPAWVIDQRVLVPGAQPHELFERVLEKLGHESGPGGEG